MRNVSNTTGPVSYGETSWETGDAPEAFTGKSRNQELIFQANTIPLTFIFKYYGVKTDNGRNNVTCPFKSHQGGRESSASFRFYPATNSFKCYGCNVGGNYAHGCEFVAAMENISRSDAAVKIIQLFGDNVNLENCDDFSLENFHKRLEIMLNFSNVVLEFRQTYFDDKSFNFIENICLIYDKMNFKHKLTNEALGRIIDELISRIKNYTL